MKCTVLVENHAGGKLGAEHGLSYLIDTGFVKILFDTGHSDLFIQNAKLLGLDLQNAVDIIVLSHGHWDHGNGLKHLHNKTLVAHPGVFKRRFRKGEEINIGIDLSREEIHERFNVKLTRKPLELAKGVFFLGEIPRRTLFESKTTPFILENGEPDFIEDDSGIAFSRENALSLFTGCAHSGVVNMTEYAKEVTSMSDLSLITGGFHLKKVNEQTLKTIEYFKNEKPDRLYASHCTDLPALALFQQNFQGGFVKTGDVLEF